MRIQAILTLVVVVSTCTVVSTTDPACGGTVTNSSGYIESPNYPGISPGIRCTWNIRAPYMNVIAATVLDLDTSVTDELIFHDNNWRVLCGGGCEWRTLQGNLARTDLKANYTHWSGKNELEIQFKTYQYARGRGFKIFYKFVSSKTCADPGKPFNGAMVPMYNFSGIYLAGERVSVTCNDGYHPASYARLSVLCKARTDGGRARWDPYQISKALCHADCGGNLTAPVGVISSPGQYPYFYETPTECTWEIRAPDGYTIFYEFKGIELEYRYPADTLEVLEGDILMYSWAGSYSRANETLRPPATASFSGNVTVDFKTSWDSLYGPAANLTYSKAGFQMYYRFIPGGSTRVGECVDPGIVDNAVRLPVQGPYKVGDSVEYRCEDGFELVGNTSITCLQVDDLSTGLLTSWDFKLPSCEAKCEKYRRTDQAYGSIKSPGWPVSTARWWTHQTGFYCNWAITATKSIKLYFNRTYFWDNQIKYEWLKVFQGDVLLVTLNKRNRYPPNNTIIVKPVTGVNTTVSIKWHGEYIRGISLNLYFSTEYCGSPGSPVNGRLIGNSFLPGDSVSFQCDNGYQLVGSETITCVSGEVYMYKWNDDIPLCKHKHDRMCPELHAPAHGYVSAPNRTEGSTATFWCTAGFHVQGSQSRTCGTDGKWSGVPAVCINSDCTVLPPKPDKGQIVYMEFPSLVYVAVFYCDQGHYLDSGNDTRVCNVSSKTWTGTQPVCKPVDCGIPASPKWGHISLEASTYTNNVTYFCDVGYELYGDMSRTCRANATWSGFMPTCRVVTCGNVPTFLGWTISYRIKNGTSIGGRGYIYTTTVWYYCNAQAYVIDGPVYSVCQADGQWSLNQTLKCVLPKCPRPEAPRNGFLLNSQTEYSSGSGIRFACNSGYILRGRTQIICKSDESWDGDVPNCTKALPSTTTTTTVVTTLHPEPPTTTVTSWTSTSKPISHPTSSPPRITSFSSTTSKDSTTSVKSTMSMSVSSSAHETTTDGTGVNDHDPSKVSSGSNNSGQIAGGVIGGIVATTLLTLCLLYLVRRQWRNRDQSLPSYITLGDTGHVEQTTSSSGSAAESDLSWKNWI